MHRQSNLLSELPQFNGPDWNEAVHKVLVAKAPLRFSVVGHDPQIENSAILAWGLDYGDGEVIVESTRGERRWLLNAAEDIRKYFPAAPVDGLEIIWLDGPSGIIGRTGTPAA